MGMPQAARRYTVDEVLALPSDGNRYEPVHGGLLVTRTPRNAIGLLVAAAAVLNVLLNLLLGLPMGGLGEALATNVSMAFAAAAVILVVLRYQTVRVDLRRVGAAVGVTIVPFAVAIVSARLPLGSRYKLSALSLTLVGVLAWWLKLLIPTDGIGRTPPSATRNQEGA